MTTTDIFQPANWWGNFQVPLNTSLTWSIGPFTLQILRREKEWLIWHENATDNVTDQDSWTIEKNRDLDAETGDIQRHVFSSTTEQLWISPKLADRSIVIKTVKPLHIQSRQQIDIYVSTPIWFGVSVHDTKTELHEIPIARPSDTWFGPSTQVGELCYASTTQARLYLTELPQRPHRAISQVSIQNQSEKPLLLSQISLPTPYLSLFDTGQGGLWTEAITLSNDDHSDLAKVTFSESPRHPYAHTKKITPAREKKDRNMLLNSFSTLFS
jgi:hypothetical protein